MEQWEKELREKLEKELPEGGYDIGNSGMVCWTGKQGYIEYRVALIKTLDNFDWSVDKANNYENNPTSVHDLDLLSRELVLRAVLTPPPHPADISKSVNEGHKEVLSVDEIIERYALTEEQIKNLQKLNK